jgi:hypothetical protein
MYTYSIFIFYFYHRLGVKSLVLESWDSLRVTGFGLAIWENAWKALIALGVGDILRHKHIHISGYNSIAYFQFNLFTFLIIKSNKTFILLELGVQECDYFFDYRAGNRYYVF